MDITTAGCSPLKAAPSSVSDVDVSHRAWIEGNWRKTSIDIKGQPSMNSSTICTNMENVVRTVRSLDPISSTTTSTIFLGLILDRATEQGTGKEIIQII